jgi:hypothetical protein
LLSAIERVLVVTAHPDDCDFGGKLEPLHCGVKKELKFHTASAPMVIKVVKFQLCHGMKTPKTTGNVDNVRLWVSSWRN